MSNKEKQLWEEIARLNLMGHAAMRIRRYVSYASAMGILHPNGDFKVALEDFDKFASKCDFINHVQS